MATISERLRENADFVGREDTRKTVNEAADTIDALVAALEELAGEARYACDAIRFPSLTEALAEADAALARAKG